MFLHQIPGFMEMSTKCYKYSMSQVLKYGALLKSGHMCNILAMYGISELKLHLNYSYIHVVYFYSNCTSTTFLTLQWKTDWMVSQKLDLHSNMNKNFNNSVSPVAKNQNLAVNEFQVRCFYLVIVISALDNCFFQYISRISEKKKMAGMLWPSWLWEFSTTDFNIPLTLVKHFHFCYFPDFFLCTHLPVASPQLGNLKEFFSLLGKSCKTCGSIMRYNHKAWLLINNQLNNNKINGILKDVIIKPLLLT